MRRHFESAQLHKSETAAAAVGRIKFVDAELRAMRVAGYVDEQVAEKTIDEPRWNLFRRAKLPFQFAERSFNFVERIVARFIHTRMLACRPDEQPAEQKRKRWMVLPVRDQAAQQIGPATAKALREIGRASCRERV